MVEGISGQIIGWSGLDQKSWAIRKIKFILPSSSSPGKETGSIRETLGPFVTRGLSCRALLCTPPYSHHVLPTCAPNLCPHVLAPRSHPPLAAENQPKLLAMLVPLVSSHIGLHIVCRYDLDLLEVSLDISCFYTTTHPKHTIQIIFYKLPLSCPSSKVLRGQGYYWGRSDETVS